MLPGDVMAVCLKKAINSYGATNDRGDVARPLMSLAVASSVGAPGERIS